MPKLLRVLILEDSENDALLLLRELRRAEYTVQYTRVESAEGMLAALEAEKWDIILSDYSMPSFSAPEALKLVQAKELDIPFIIVSGTVGEDIAVESMRAGTHDFFTKDKLVRLVPAIERELRDVGERQTRKQMEKALRQAEERFSQAFLANPSAICISSLADHIVLDVNPRFLNLFGYQYADVIGQKITELSIWGDEAIYLGLMHSLEAKKTIQNAEVQFHASDQSIRDTLVSLEKIDLSGEACALMMIHNITERKQAEKELRALHNATGVLFNANNVQDLAQQIVNAIVQEFDQADCGLMLLDKADNIRRVARSGARSIQTAAPIHLDGQGLVPEAVRTGQMIYAPDVSLDPRYVSNAPQTRSELVVPLRTATKTLGALDLQSDQPKAFSQQDQRVLLAFAERAAAALEIMALYEEINRHATDLESHVARRTAELYVANQRLEAIFNNSSDAITLIDADMRIHQTNPAFDLMFEYQIEEISGQVLTRFVEQDQAEALKQAIQTVVKTKLQQRIELVGLRKDQTLFNVDAALSPIIDYDTQKTNVICSFRDITERSQLEQSLRVALHKEKELNELKSRFTSMVSHEFRTPLAVIQMSAGILKSYIDRLSAEAKNEHHYRIESQIKRLTQLLDDILVIGQAEAVGLPFEPQVFNLENFCLHAVEESQLTTDIHQIQFNIEGDCGKVFMDKVLLHQIISNLLSNAIKYSPLGGRIYLRVSCSKERVLLVVQDQGAGILPEDQEQLFQTFHRGKNVGTIQGTGLGLAIVKRAVDAHNGTVSFESEVDKGTTFTITLPRMASSNS